jgi:hypothetical protein
MEWSPLRIIDWAGKIGPQTRALAEAILPEQPHPGRVRKKQRVA